LDTRIPLEMMPDSGAFGSYGPSEDASPSHGESFDVPHLMVDDKGRIISAETVQITLPPTSSLTTVDWEGVTNKPTSFTPSSHSSATTEYGVSSSTNYGHSMASSTVPIAAGIASVGEETSSFARGDHVHPAQTTISGNAGTATKLETSRSITLTGDASGSVNFDGSENVSISVSTVKEVSYTTTEPDSSSTELLDNESVIFYAEGSSSGSSFLQPVYTSGNQTIDGVKTFASGIFKNALTVDSSSSIFDVSQSTCFLKTITAPSTFTFINVPSGLFCHLTVILKNGGSHLVVWPSTVVWSKNETPDLAADGIDILTFITCDGGNSWFGNIFYSSQLS